MSEPRTISARLFDFTADGTLIIIYGQDGEHLNVKIGHAQVVNLEHAISKYIAAYKPQEETCA